MLKNVGQLPDPHRDSHVRIGSKSTGEEVLPPLRYFASFFCLHHLRHEAAHRLCGFVLLLPRSVGVGAECESSVIVAEHTADGFNVHPILQCQRCEGVSEVVKSDVLSADGLQDLLMGVAEGVRVEHGAGLGRHEQVGTVWVLCVLLHWCCHCGDNNKHPESYPPTRTACHLRFAAHAT